MLWPCISRLIHDSRPVLNETGSHRNSILYESAMNLLWIITQSYMNLLWISNRGWIVNESWFNRNWIVQIGDESYLHRDCTPDGTQTNCFFVFFLNFTIDSRLFKIQSRFSYDAPDGLTTSTIHLRFNYDSFPIFFWPQRIGNKLAK